jgi:hypothetical protein
MSEETIRVRTCPHCKGAHTYRLEVERARVITMSTSRKKGEHPSTVKITSRLLCPLRDEPYQASFYLKDTASDRIKAVSVIGLMRES